MSTPKMQLQLCPDGLTRHEIDAIHRVAETFGPKAQSVSVQTLDSKASFSEQLGQATGHSQSGMWPWKGYAGFRLSGRGGESGEFDLVLITHTRVLIVELKHWNGTLTESNGNWYLNDDSRGRSAVAVTQRKVYLLMDLLKKYSGRFRCLRGTRHSVPYVDFRVVLTGAATAEHLPNNEAQKTLGLSQFLCLANEKHYQECFGSKSKRPGPNKDLDLFDEIFDEKKLKPRHLVFNGYQAEERIFPLEEKSHPYNEFLAVNKADRNDFALLRQWLFDQISDPQAQTPEGRFQIVSREQAVLSEIRRGDADLANERCLSQKKPVLLEDMSVEVFDIFDIPHCHKRFNAFVDAHLKTMSEVDRIALVNILLDAFARLHRLKIAHRDVGDHSLWLSPALKIRISSFAPAYHQGTGTVGDIRPILSVRAIPLPSDPNRKLKGETPFTEDVFCLGVLAWMILRAERLSTASLSQLPTELKAASSSWYAESISHALQFDPRTRFENAAAFHEAFIQAKPKDAAMEVVDMSDFERYTVHEQLYKLYPEDEELDDDGSVQVIRSGNTVLKIWDGVIPDRSEPGVAAKILQFLERASELKSIDPDYLPSIHKVFLAHRSKQLVLVQSHISGRGLDALIEHPGELLRFSRVDIARQLVSALEHLHKIGQTHGDLHPGNVLVVEDASGGLQIKLIDMPSFNAGAIQARNHIYSPEQIDAVSARHRDNYGVARICAQLLEIDWNDPKSAEGDLAEIGYRIDVEQQSEIGFETLEQIGDALKQIGTDQRQDSTSVKIGLRDVDGVVRILPDNHQLYVTVSPQKDRLDRLYVSLVGFGGRLNLSYDPQRMRIERCFRPRKNDWISNTVRRQSDFNINVELSIEPSSGGQWSELETLLENNVHFNSRLESLKRERVKERIEKVALIDESATETAPSARTRNSTARPRLSLSPATQRIWRAVISTEEEVSPRIELSAPPVLVSARAEVRLPFTSEQNLDDKYQPSDVVHLIDFSGRRQIDLGQINIRSSNGDHLVIDRPKRRSHIASLKEGTILHLRSRQENASFSRRARALDRILERESVIPDLVDYFDPKKNLTPLNIGTETATDADFAVYEQPDEHGRSITIDLSQRKAFNTILTQGPLSLLQGPPGTGKTEFIAAFVHFLISRTDARSILLASQSHEAVNTAAERIRSHCNRFDTALDLVRFSNSPAVVSDSLADAYAGNIVWGMHERVKAEFAQRVLGLQRALGVPKDYLVSVMNADREVGGAVRQWQRLSHDLESVDYTKREKAQFKNKMDRISSEQIDILKRQYKIDQPQALDMSERFPEALRSLSRHYGIQSHEQERVLELLGLLNDYQARLASENVNYEEFLTRSRTLVCGTCVGIGRTNAAIAEHAFDWVIVDEAARSSSSELAVAMQSGKRVLLVGDHKQLPPLYLDEHKDAIATELKLDPESDEFARMLASDFERAFLSGYGEVVGVTLHTQYRMIRPIGDLISTVFYDEALLSARNLSPPCFERGPECIFTPVSWIDTCDLGKAGEHSTDVLPSLFNQAEIDVILSMLDEIHASSGFCDELAKLADDGQAAIGVICMYAEQVRRLREAFNKKPWSEGFRELIKIGTVDSYQGKENRVVIVSLTRNSLKDGPGFLRTANRINVAMSRAMDRLVIVGGSAMWTQRFPDTPLSEVYRYIQSQSDEQARIVGSKSLHNSGSGEER